jgi:hypothetical protein
LWLRLLLWCAVLLLPGVALAARHRTLAVGHRASSHSRSFKAETPRAKEPSAHGRVRGCHKREHHVRPHTARALKHARRHGTDAVRLAARAEAQRVARGESTADASDSASMKLPERPLAIMNLPPLRGTHESLVRQNTRAEQDGLLRVKDDVDLGTLRHAGSLVSLPETTSMHVDGRLPMNRRYCRTWTGHFLTDLARAHYERFHRPLQVNSAVRTIEYQRHLLHINGNAAPAEGDVASPHLTGAAVDVAKKGLSPSEVAWMRSYLLPLQTAGKIDVEEEFKQSCFHISVYRSYVGLHGDVAAAGKASALMASGIH